MATLKLKTEEVVSFAKSVLMTNGIDELDADVIIDHLLDGELAGHSSHGFFRIPGIINAQKNASEVGDISLENESPCSCRVNGNNRQGLVVALKAAEVTVEKALQAKVAVVGGYRYIGTTGSMGYFTRRIAEQGLIGLMIANSEEGVSPWGSADMILGTNPISISIPSDSDPIVADLATAKWAYGDLAIAMREGRSIPEGIVLDKDGNPSTDPNDANVGSQLPFGEHKGYALGLAVEILAGPLVGAKAGVEAVQGSDGFLMMAIHPEVFVPLASFRTQVSRLIDEIKNSRLRPGFNEILYPGERSHRIRKINQQTGYVEILDHVWETLKGVGSS